VGGQTYDISSRGYAVGSVPRLHLVCRQIYNEASTMPFSLNVFSSRTPFSLSHFILPLSSSQRDAIRTIQFVLTGKTGASYELWTNDPASAGHASILEGLQTVLIVWICRKRSPSAEEEEIRELQRVVGFWRAGITVRKSEQYHCCCQESGKPCGPLSECQMLSLANGG